MQIGKQKQDSFFMYNNSLNYKVLIIFHLNFMNQNNKFHPQSFFNHPIQYVERENSSRPHNGPFAVVQGQRDSRQRQRGGDKLSRWSNLQKQRYSIFICYFRQILCESSSNGNKWNTFKAMSKYIQSRNPQQCRSYHLKLLTQFHTIPRFISIVAKRLPSLRKKIILAENQLNSIQLEFNLFIEEEKLQYNVVSDNGVEKEEGKLLVKTSDTYVEEPGSISQYYPSFAYQGLGAFNDKITFQSSFKTFNHQTGKATIPSFAEEQGQQEHDKQKKEKCETKEIKNPFVYSSAISEGIDWMHGGKFEEQVENNETEKKNSEKFIQSSDPYIRQVSKTENNSFPNEAQQKKLQKMKQILECHYLFQLWTSKLQKIMRG